MKTNSVLIALLFAGAALALPQPTLAAASARHDGTVERVDAREHVLVIREYGRGGHATDFRAQLAPDVHVTMSDRSARAIDAQHEFSERPMNLSAIKRGDFVVLDVTGHGSHRRAESVMVTLRGSAA